MDTRYQVIVGDCLEVLPTLPEASASAVITDPPYGISYRSKHAKGFDPIANDERPFIWWLPGAVRILKEPGVLICFCDRYEPAKGG